MLKILATWGYRVLKLVINYGSHNVPFTTLEYTYIDDYRPIEYTVVFMG